MINKILPNQGLMGSKSTNSLSNSNLDFLDERDKSGEAVLQRNTSATSKEVAKTNTKPTSSQRSNSLEESVGPQTKEETFKKSLKTAITEKKSEPTSRSNKLTESIGVEESDLTVDSVDRTSSEGVIPVTFNSTTRPPLTNEVDSEGLVDTSGEIQAVIKFMKSMKEEFEVSPDELVGVMTSMSQQLQALAQMQTNQGQGQGQPFSDISPDKTQTEVFKTLGLEGGQIRRAQYLYQNMLKEMAQDSMSNYLKEQDQEASIQILSPTELRKRDMGRSLDRLNQSFFMNDTRLPYGKTPQEMSPQLDPKSIQSQSNQNNDAKNRELNALAGGAMVLPQDMEMVEPQSVAINETQLNSNKNAKQINDVSDDSSSGSGLPLASLLAPLAGANASTGSGMDGHSESNQKNTKSASIDGLANSKTAKEVESNTTSEANPSALGAVTQKTEARTGAETFSLTAAANEARANDARPEDAENVKSLIQNAQVLMRKGGGEMKIKMSPEGLGQVDLKVAVKDGKVDIQILADTADTKRLLEKGLGDLKSSLVGHRLEVNNVKVDVSQNPDRDLNQSQGDLSREQARQFLGQFRDERESFRALGDLPRMRSYRQSAAAQVTPETGKEDQPASKNSTRLNVIA